MVFEWCAHGDLHALLQAQRSANRYLSERQVLNLFTQIVAGVRHLHAHGIIHRDLKSLNVVLAGPPRGAETAGAGDRTHWAHGRGRDGARAIPPAAIDELAAKICDLGISRRASDDTLFMQTFCGTPAYLSPELVASQVCRSPRLRRPCRLRAHRPNTVPPTPRLPRWRRRSCRT